MPWLFEVVIEDERKPTDIKTERHFVEAESIYDVADDFRRDGEYGDRTVVSIIRHVPISRHILYTAGE
jgi:hypothetical protein